MAVIHPSIENLLLTTPGAYRERDVLLVLQDGLPENFDVYHSVNWSSVHQDQQRFGEIDALVLSPLGHITLLEVKAGDLNITDNNITKH